MFFWKFTQNSSFKVHLQIITIIIITIILLLLLLLLLLFVFNIYVLAVVITIISSVRPVITNDQRLTEYYGLSALEIHLGSRQLARVFPSQTVLIVITSAKILPR